MSTVKEKILSGQNGIAKFFNSVGFIWILALVTFLFWYIGEDLTGLAIISVLMGAVLFFCEDATPVISCFTFLFFVFSDTAISFTGRELYALLLIIPVAGFVYNIVRFKAKGFRMTGFALAMLVVFIPWILQGIGVENRVALRALICVLLAVGFTGAFFLLSITSRRDGKKLCGYYLNVLLALSVLIMLQITVFHLRIKDYTFDFNYIRLGWGTRNPVAAILALCLPATFYFSVKGRKLSFLFVILGYIEYIMILLLQSRGVTIFATAVMPVLIGYSIIAAKKGRLANGIVHIVLALSLLFIFLFRKEWLEYLFNRLLSKKLAGNGRNPIWADGINSFFAHPIFGIGIDYQSQVYFDIVGYTEGATFFHSTFIQIFASFGIFGGICYAYLYYWRYRIAFTDLDKAKFILIVGMLVYECYGFIDTVFFQPMGYFMMMVISLCMEKGLDNEQKTPLAVNLIERNLLKRKSAL